MIPSFSIRLESFNIQNFRSIINSGWKNLAHDNITVLIGQNESGKTSVLEALKSFYDGKIHDDILRGDLSMPVVSCKFIINKGKLSDVLDKERLPKKLYNMLANKKEVVLTRKWTESKSSALYIGDEEIHTYYNELKELDDKLDKDTKENIAELLSLADKLKEDLKITEADKEAAQGKLTETKKELDKKSKALRRARKQDIKFLSEKEHQIATEHFENAKNNLEQSLDLYNAKLNEYSEISEKVEVCDLYRELMRKTEEEKAQVEIAHKNFKESEHRFEMATTEKDIKNLKVLYDRASLSYESLLQNNNETIRSLTVQKLIASKVLSGTRLSQAEADAEREMAEKSRYYTTSELGETVFLHIPQFMFFEDFSSLLPNKIDLEDVLSRNTNVSGYKAAHNFLTISGLDAEFFREKNHRILKQKIEKLNTDITINFHDYWSQKVGKNNKITINFELEHYDYRTPEKSGKPYIEFWIKDRSERLYPKQRSRGVRWFLSFYLELKATALEKGNNRIILIDEPGLSLHAKAQEDVLKVFEDLKDELQIIYCTHSPNLVDIDKMYRILAVQRADEEDDMSESKIYGANDLSSATSDTLMPIYSLMGVRLNESNLIKKDNNILLANAVNYQYINTLNQLLNTKEEMHFIPSSGITSMHSLCSVFTGWKLGYKILLFNNEYNSEEVEILNNNFAALSTINTNNILQLSNFEAIENVFSTLDFKKFVLQKRMGITSSNYDYVQLNGLSRSVLAANFVSFVKENNISIEAFDGETQENIATLFSNLIFNQQKSSTNQVIHE